MFWVRKRGLRHRPLARGSGGCACTSGEAVQGSEGDSREGEGEGEAGKHFL